MDKKELRAAMRRQQCDPEQLQQQSTAIMERIESLSEFAAARTVAAYWPLPGEVDTREAIERWSAGKRIALPVVDGDDIVFRLYTGRDGLHTGAFGIGEPAVGEPVSPDQIDLIIIPGVAFSRKCQRLGRGKGFYDRFLSDTHAFKVGICLENRVVDNIICQPHDVDMDVVASAKELFFGKK